MSAQDQIKQLVEDFKTKPLIKDKTDAMGDGLLIAASLSDDSNELSKDIQAQVDQLVIEGDSSVEAAQARVDGDGKSYTTLKKRLDEKEQETTAQFAQKASINYVDAILMDIAKGGPNELFMSIVALESAAYPNGKEGTWLVMDSTFTDGAHSFIWDSTNSIWKDLGVYQATGISDNSIVTDKYADDSVTPLKTSFVYMSEKNIYNHDTNKADIRFGSDGQEISGVGYSSSDFIKVEAGVYVVGAPGSTETVSIQRLPFYDMNKQNVSLLSTGSSFVATRILEITVPSSGYIRLSTMQETKQLLVVSRKDSYAGFYEFEWLQDIKSLTRKKSIGKEEIVDGSIDVFSTDFIKRGKNWFDKKNVTLNSFYSTPPNTNVLNGYYTVNTPILIKANTVVTLNKVRQFYVYSFGGERIAWENTNDNTATRTFTAPNEDVLLYMSGHIDNIDITQVEEGSLITVYEPFSYVIDNLRLKADNIYGKKLLNFGDSIAAASTTGVVGYHEQIASNNSMTLIDYAKGGATITVIDEVDRHSVVEQVDKAILDGVEADYILFNGLTNDSSVLYGLGIGAISNGYADVLDTSTFCGAFEYILKTLKKEFVISYSAKIIYVRPHNMPTRDDRQVKLGDLALQMCEKWSVSYVDIYREGGLNTNIIDMVVPYSIPNDSGTHPNTSGYELFYTPLIESKMKNI